MTTEKCPQGVLLEQVTRNWDSPIGCTLVWPRGLGRFPMRGELLQDFDDKKVYSVSVGNVLRYLAKAHDAWDEQQLAKYRTPQHREQP